MIRSLPAIALLFFIPAVCYGQTAVDTTLKPISAELDQVIIRGRKSIKQDSIETRTIYKKAFEAAEFKPSVHLGLKNGFGIGIDGLFTRLAYGLSGKRKEGKLLKAQFLSDLKDRHIQERFTPQLVTTATGLTDPDSIQAFTWRCQSQIPLDYATTATSLELMMWMRQEYKRQQGDSLSRLSPEE